MNSANKLSLGTAQFGQIYGVSNTSGKTDFKEAAAIVGLALENHFKTIDTAISYGDSESVLGGIGVEQWDVITKLPKIPIECKNISEWIHETINKSLKRLKINQLEGVLLHSPEQLESSIGEEIYLSLSKLIDTGKVRKLGISIYNPNQLETIIPKYDLDIVQAPFNIIDRRLIYSGWLSKLYKKGIEVHVRSIFLQGLLLMSPSERPKKFDRWNKLWSYWHKWLINNNFNALQACMSYVLLNKEIHRVIVGVNCVKHLKEIISVSQTTLTNIPDQLCSIDHDLIDPSRWKKI